MLSPGKSLLTTSPPIRPSRNDIDAAYKVSYSNINANYSKILGTGNFGKVYTGTLHTGTKVLALKYLHADFDVEKKAIQREIDIMAELTNSNAPYTIKLAGYADKTFQHQTFFIIGMPIAKHGSLEKKFKTICLTQQYKIMYGIGVALEHMHDRNILHCDMKAENVLVDEDDNAVLADFGLSKRIDVDKMTDSEGTPLFEAIELLDYTNPSVNTKESDVYSLGMTYCQILLKQTLDEIEALYFSSCSDTDDLYDYLATGKRMPIPSEPDCPKSMAKLITFCWNENPQNRPKIKEANTALSKVIEEAKYNEEYFVPL
jgi:serine/threonine protein kinase